MFDPKELLTALAGGQGGPAGGLGGVLSNAMAQAQSGINAAASSDLGQRVGGAVSQGATIAGQAASQAGTAISGAYAQVEEQLKGTQAGAAMDRATAMAKQNPMATGAVLGGLAALLLGTQSGRDAAKLGGLAVLGGLAYKAFRNHQEGKPLTAGIPGLDQLTTPKGSGFDATDHSHESALLMARAMIAAAAAGGVVDPQERERILGKMQEAGLGADAAKFLDGELARPATAAELATAVGNAKELAAQVYAAAVFGAHTASQPEQGFLAELAKALPLEPELAAHIGAAMSHRT